MGRGRDRATKGLILSAHIQVTAIEIDESVGVNLVVTRTRQAHGRAGVDRRVITEGMEAGGRLQGQDQGARIDVHPEGAVVQGAA